GQNADADVEILAIAHDGGKKRDHDHQQDRHRLRPRCCTVEHVPGEHAVRNDQHDDDEKCAGHEQAGVMDRVHRPDVPLLHGSPFRENDRRAGAFPRSAGSFGKRSGHHFTSCIRLISSACCLPYFSHTGWTASWKGFLSSILMISTPAFSMSLFDFSSIAYQSLRSSCCASLANLAISAWSSFESVSQVFLENTRISGIIRCP